MIYNDSECMQTSYVKLMLLFLCSCFAKPFLSGLDPGKKRRCNPDTELLAINCLLHPPLSEFHCAILVAV